MNELFSALGSQTRMLRQTFLLLLICSQSVSELILPQRVD